MPKTPITQDVFHQDLAERLCNLIYNTFGVIPLPQSIEELCTFLNASRHQLWRACEESLAATPMTCLDYIRAQYILSVLSKSPTVKLLRLRRDLGMTSEDGFRRYCQRTFGMLPHDVKANYEQAANAVQIRFGTLLDALNRLKENQLKKERVSVSKKPTHKTDTQNRHTKLLKRRFERIKLISTLSMNAGRIFTNLLNK
jgi:AraC-like DNA-binding protein